MDKHKVLVVFPESTSSNERAVFISTIFQQQLDDTEAIIRDVPWKTRYYEVGLDLYIDTYEELDTWTMDFLNEECEELRDVISGIIFVFNDQEHEQKVNLMTHIIDQIGCDSTSKFYIGCNFHEKVIDEQALLSMNDKLLGSNLEMVNWFDKTDDPMDKVGSERIKEILDVYQWPTLASQAAYNRATSGNALRSVDLPSFMVRLDEVKQKYQSMEDRQSAERFVEDMVEELSDLLV